MTVQFEGQERTMQYMRRYLEEPDRGLRQRAWEASEGRRLRDRAKLDQVFDDLVRVRHRIAVNAGFENYRDYAFRKKERFEYTRGCVPFPRRGGGEFRPPRAGDLREGEGEARNRHAQTLGRLCRPGRQTTASPFQQRRGPRQGMHPDTRIGISRPGEPVQEAQGPESPGPRKQAGEGARRIQL